MLTRALVRAGATSGYKRASNVLIQVANRWCRDKAYPCCVAANLLSGYLCGGGTITFAYISANMGVCESKTFKQGSWGLLAKGDRPRIRKTGQENQQGGTVGVKSALAVQEWT